MNQAYLFNTGDNFQSYKMLGARPDLSHDGEPGFRFAVWAPNAKAVSVVGDFNFWNTERDPLILMAQLESDGIYQRCRAMAALQICHQNRRWSPDPQS